MKKIYLYFTAVLFISFAGLFVTGCNDDSSESGSTELTIYQFFPTKVFEGQEVQITGTRLDEVTAVVFPGGKSVTTFKKIGTGMITVVTPADVSNGTLSVQAGNNTASAKIPLTVGNPRINSMMPDTEAGIGRELNIAGVDMEFYTKAIFPGKEGDIVVNANEFSRKSTIFIFVNVPDGIESGPARIKLVTTSGREDLLPEIELLGVPDEPEEVPDVVVWEGEHDMRGWANALEIKAQWFRDAGLTIKQRDIVKFHFTPYNDWHQFKINNSSWAGIALPENQGESGDVGVVSSAVNLKDVDGVFQFQINETLLPMFTATGATTNALIINGEGLTFTKITVQVAK